MIFLFLYLICGVSAFYLLKNYIESNLRSLPSPPENIAQAMRNAAKRDDSVEEIYNSSDDVICAAFWTIILVESLLIWPVNLVILLWWKLFDKQDFSDFRGLIMDDTRECEFCRDRLEEFAQEGIECGACHGNRTLGIRDCFCYAYEPGECACEADWSDYWEDDQ